MSPSSTAQRLAHHVRVCRFDDRLIFLDLCKDKYIGIGGPSVSALFAAVCDEGASTNIPEHTYDKLLHAAIKRLRDHQLLSDTPTQTQKRPSPTVTEPVASLNVDAVRESMQADWRTLVRLWQATIVATIWLRRFSLFDIVNRVIALRTCYRAVEASNDEHALRTAVVSYVRLRPFALTSHDRCLKDSLTLILFLAGQGLFPEWVIGVRIHPFGAHSWVQQQGVVLNDFAERVRHYRAILVV